MSLSTLEKGTHKRANQMISENCDKRIKQLIAKMILKQSYWGYLFSRIIRIEDKSIPSIMGVAPEPDGVISLRYNPIFFDNTGDDAIEVVLEHEGMHLLNKHIPRLLRLMNFSTSREQKDEICMVFNLASDCAVNEQMGAPRIIKVCGSECKLLFPDMFNLPPKHVTEFYFNELMQRRDKSKEQNGNRKGEGEGQGENNGTGIETIDDHTSWKEVSEEDANTIARKVENYITELVKDSVKSLGNKRGNIPSHISQLIDDVLGPPQLPYYQIIRKLVKGSRVSKFKSSSTRINRKRTYVFAIDQLNVPEISPFPGRTRDYTFSITIIIDTSGSVNKEQLLEALCGIKNIIENDRHCTTTVLEIDVIVQKEYRVKRLGDIDCKMKGRGGTVLFPAFQRAKELKSDIVMCFTDGGCENFNEISKASLPKKILWIVNAGTDHNINKTGWVVHIDKE
jgi:predicted metal-dependent peptidase